MQLPIKFIHRVIGRVKTLFKVIVYYVLHSFNVLILSYNSLLDMNMTCVDGANV